MATAAVGFGEHRFGAAYTMRILAVLGVLGLLAGLWSAQNDLRAASHPQLVWVSVGLLAACAALWIALGKTVLIINGAGVRRESILGQQEMAWEEIVETRYRVVPVNVYAHLGLIGAVLAMSSKSGRAQLNLQLIGSNGKKLKVTSNFRNADRAIGIILGRILPPMVQKVKARLGCGETVPFGQIGLSATSITWKGTSIPVSDVASAELAGSNLRVKRQGKWLATISIRSDKVPNVLVFLEALESLAPQVKSTGIDPLARVRM
jgi:uncharacterized protein DUF6585